MRKKIIAGNWKMHGNKDSIKQLINGIEFKIDFNSDVECIVFPPTIYIDYVKQLTTKNALKIGSQNLCFREEGASTGEISGAMLQDCGCRTVLVGHSERRHIFQESEEIVAAKFIQAQKYGLIPILCVGETESEREQGMTNAVIKAQIDQVMNLQDVTLFAKAVIAYEPVWAIGTGKTASPDQAQYVHHMIRRYIAQQSPAIAEELSIIYGGSVKPNNAKALFGQPDIDGGLIGGASLDAVAFVEIYHSAR